MALTLDGTSIATPQKFDIERYKLTKSGRVASGKMTMEVLARKVKFNLSYTVITGVDLDTILDIIDTNTAFFTFTYPEADGTTGTKTVYPGAIKGNYLRNVGADILFNDVSFALIEQ